MQQTVFLFNSSIYDNITMFKSYSKDRIDNAVKMAGLSKLIDDKGYDYICGGGGVNLSGGESQRVSIARSLLWSTPILVMDEATGALDNSIATDITDKVLNIKDTIKIVVTHKLDAKQMGKYDEIIVIQDGQIIEKGNFNSLMEKKELFHVLFSITGGAT